MARRMKPHAVRAVVLAVMCLLLLTSSVSAKVLYVDSTAGAAGDGSSWTNAFRHLQDALRAARAGDEIWVTEGSYRPDQGDGMVAADRRASFSLAAGVAVYGGFPCGGCLWTERDPVAHRVILSGDLAGNDDPLTDPCDLLVDPNRAENCYHVIDCRGVSNGTVLDGLTITGGHACGGSGDNARLDGGGLYIRFGSPTVYNCRFVRNAAADNGGAIYCRYASPLIEACTIVNNAAKDGAGIWCRQCLGTFSKNAVKGNYADADGGGILCREDGGSAIVENEITGNIASDGAGMYMMDQSYAIVQNNLLRANVAEDNGGAIHCRDSGPHITGNVIEANGAADGAGIWCKDASPAIVNNVIARNTATDEGGAICCRDGCSPSIRNNTLVANVASAGGGIHCRLGSGQVITNCILWAHSGGNLHGCEATYSCVEGGADGSGNVSLYPYFVGMTFGDYHLQPYSPCIDAGDSSVVPADELDIDGDVRVCFQVDMGADEAWVRSADEDDDGLPDRWERVYFKNSSAGPLDDPDGDGATNLQEYRAGTYPAPGVETVYVRIADHADPQADGSRAHPFSSVVEGIDASLANVLVAQGTYRESIVIDSKVLHIRGGYAPDFNDWDPVQYPTILDAEGRRPVVRYRSAPGGSLEAFTITGGHGDRQEMDEIELESGASYGGGIDCSSSSPLIEHNHITGNMAYDGAGIHCRGLAAPTIRNNFITNNIAEDDGGGIFCDDDFGPDSPEITNNTIAGNQAGGSGGGIYCKKPATPVIRNCIVWGNGDELRECVAYFSCVQDEQARGEGNLLGQAPYFVDAESGDYHLYEYSPCINKGDDSVVRGDDRDIDGEPRILLGRVDMGADESLLQSPDDDHDGLPDAWERLHFGSTAPEPGDDPDGDGFTTLDEYRSDSPPTQAATTRRIVYVSAVRGSDVQGDGSIGYPLVSIQHAIHLASEKVIVATGTYKERIEIDAKTLEIEGGYDETFTQWDPVAHPTILQGARGGPVVTYRDSLRGSLRGFVITGGVARDGGGIYCLSSSPEITHNTIVGNRATDDGGGIYCKEDPSPTIAANIIQSNRASDNGGGVYCRNTSLRLVNNMIRWNFANDGAGVWCRDSAASLVNNTVIGNIAEDTGGGIYCRGRWSTRPTTIVNCIVWENVACGEGPQIALGTFADPSAPILSCCVVEGGVSSIHRETGCQIIGDVPNLDVDPLLTVEGHLRSGSPCIDAGTNGEICADDIDGEGRPWGDRADIGCDEFTDTDQDHLPDWWESAYFGSPLGAGANADTDQDKLTNLEEYEDYMSNPTAMPILVTPSLGFAEAFHSAIGQARDGDTVLFAPGQYAVGADISLNLLGKNVILHAYGGADATVLDCGDSRRSFNFASQETPGTAIVGFTLKNATIRCDRSHPQIRDCAIVSSADPNAPDELLTTEDSLVALRDCAIDMGPSGLVRTEFGGVRLAGTIELVSGEWEAQDLMLTGPGVLRLNRGSTLSLDDSRIRCHVCGPGSVRVDEDSELIVEGQAVIGLAPPVPSTPPGTIECEGLLRVRDHASICDANIVVTRASFEGAAYVANSIITAGSPYGQFFIEDTAVIQGNEIHADGDRYLDLDPAAFAGVMEKNRIYVTITEGVGQSMGGLLELRGAPDLVGAGVCDTNNPFFCQAEPMPDFDPTSWAIEELRLKAGAKINLTNRFDFQWPYDADGENEVLYVKNLVLEEGAVLNTAFNRICYGQWHADVGAVVKNAPLLGFSLNNIALDDATEFVARVQHNNLLHRNPNEQKCDRIHVERLEGREPDPNGVMRMRNLVDTDPNSSSFASVINARAQGVFAKASERTILVLFEYLFETSDPEVELAIYLTDAARLVDPCDPARADHYIEVARLRPPPPGRPGASDSGCFGLFHQYVDRGDLNFVRGTRLELELTGPKGASVLINNWDPQVHCSGYCGDVTGEHGVTVLDFLTVVAHTGSRACLLDEGDTTCLELTVSEDGRVDALDIGAWSWMLGQPRPLNFCEEPLMPGLGTRTTAGAAMAGLGPISSVASADHPLDALLVMGKPYGGDGPDAMLQDRLCVLNAEGAPLKSIGVDLGPMNGKLIRGPDEEVYLVNHAVGVVRLADSKVIVTPATFDIESDPRFETPARVHVGLGQESVFMEGWRDSVPAWVGRPVMDAVFDAGGDLYIVPVLVQPDVDKAYSDANEPYEMAAKLRVLEAGDPPYELEQLYSDHPLPGDNQYLNNMRAIDLDTSGNLYVLNTHSINRSDILWVFNAATGTFQSRVEFANPGDRCFLGDGGATAMHVSRSRNELYLAPSLNDPEADTSIVHVLSTNPLCAKGSIEIRGMGHITDITEDDSTGALWVTGFTMKNIPEYIDLSAEPFYKPCLARVPSPGSVTVAASCLWDGNRISDEDIALPTAILWTGPRAWVKFARFASQWRATGCESPDWCDGADLDRDGTVTMLDLTLFCARWLQTSP